MIKKRVVIFGNLAISITAIIFLSFLFLSCQKAKEPESKKEVQVQKEEVKQQSSPSETKPEAQRRQKEYTPTSSQEAKTVQKRYEEEKEAEFKEPVLLWEREFDPPLMDISDQNSAGEYIAVQGGGKEGRPTKILFLDSKGKTVREIPLGKKEKRKIPPEQVWLTYYGEEYKDEKFKKSFAKGKEIEVAAERAFIFENGEYYGIVTQDTAVDCAGPEADCYGSPWYEFSYYDRTGKFIWKVIPDVNYGFMNAHISHDGSRIILIDEANLDYFGQKWYLYDEKGRLLKTEDHLSKTDGTQTQEDWDKEKAEWISEIKIARNGQYIVLVGPRGVSSKVKLLDNKGQILWGKTFGENQSISDISPNGNVLLFISAKGLVSINKKGKLLWETKRGRGRFSENGRYVVKIDSPSDPVTRRAYGWDVIYLFENENGNLILETTPDELMKDAAKKKYYVNSLSFLEKGYFLISFYEYPGGFEKKNIFCLYDIEKKTLLWTIEGIGGEIRVSDKDIQVVDLYVEKYRGQKIKVYQMGGHGL